MKKKKEKGRPSYYTKHIADKIIFQLIEGKGLVEICKNEKMPCVRTVYYWLDNEKYEDFLHRYMRAREIQADILVDEILEIADDSSNDYITKIDKRGNTFEAVDHENINRSRLRVDTRKWYASKMRPKKYGDKLDLTSNGSKIEANPIVVQNMATKKELEKLNE